jgi:hypothetical protein
MMGPMLGRMPRAKFDAAHYAAVSDLWAQVRALAPISSQLTIHNCAHNGWSIQQLAASPGDVDASYENGKTNFLFFWELTNNIHNDGRTGAQTIADAIAYISARQAYVAANRPGQKPWRVVLMTGLPRGDYLNAFTAPQGEVEMQYCNTYIRQHYRDMGAVAYVEARRAGGPFDFTDVTNPANFPSSLWADRTHPNNGAGGGKSVLAQYIADLLKRLPAR